MKQVKKTFPVFAGFLVLAMLAFGLSQLLQSTTGPLTDTLPQVNETAPYPPPEATEPISDQGDPVAVLEVRPPGEGVIPTPTPRPQPTRIPDVTVVAFPTQPPAKDSASWIYYREEKDVKALELGLTGELIGETQPLPTNLDFNPIAGAQSPDGLYLVLLRPTEVGAKPYIFEYASGQVWPLWQGHPLVSEISGMVYGWHPDSKQVLFWSANAYSLYLVNVETGKFVELAVTSLPLQGAAMSPDGQSIVYITGSETSYRAMWTVSTAGGDARVLFDIGGPSSVYGWSPDGSQILYAAAEGPLWLMDPEGEKRNPLKGEYLFGYSMPPPAWSPDGHWVAFTGLDEGQVFGCGKDSIPDNKNCRYEGTAVFIENINTGDVKRLSSGIGPTWLPDGSALVFLSNQSGATEVWTISPTGENLKQLTTDGTDKNLLSVWPK